MKKIIVKNLEGIQTHGAEMEDPSLWIEDCIAQNLWGLPERQEIGEDGKPTDNILPATYTIEILDMSDEIEQHKWEELRLKRNSVIAVTDWVLLNDSPLNPEKKGQYAIYRQALRDLPENTSDIDNPPWPVKPS